MGKFAIKIHMVAIHSRQKDNSSGQEWPRLKPWPFFLLLPLMLYVHLWLRSLHQPYHYPHWLLADADLCCNRGSSKKPSKTIKRRTGMIFRCAAFIFYDISIILRISRKYHNVRKGVSLVN